MLRLDNSSLQLSGTREIAEACLNRLEKRLRKLRVLLQAYCRFWGEFRDLDHLEVVPVANAMYVTHHAVDKGGDYIKIRVVFIAAE